MTCVGVSAARHAGVLAAALVCASCCVCDTVLCHPAAAACACALLHPCGYLFYEVASPTHQAWCELRDGTPTVPHCMPLLSACLRGCCC